ncbi:HDHD1 [Cordylochernes scorpioides]|uniref:HDHD1 n=1 Tax=Cordylochernes scorpioides TaxID=51811 RepID=A0ABY6LJ16_9ARAC|nr:HDHD1 [Cordylochernes scorpioides]
MCCPDTEDLYTEATENIAQRYGKHYPWSLKEKVMGMAALSAATAIVQGLELPLTPEHYLDLIEQEYVNVFPRSKLLPGVEKLVRHLHSHDIPIAIATSSKRSSYELKTAHHAPVFDLFHHVVCGSSDPEVKVGKPAPDTFLVCAQRFNDGVDPSKVLVLEDSPIGITAAKAAGMQAVMIPDPRFSGHLSNLADLVLPSMENFQPELFGLPPYSPDTAPIHPTV